MSAFITMARNVLLFVALAIPGFLLVKTKKLPGQTSVTLSTVLLNCGLPFLIISGMMNVELTKKTFIMMLAGVGVFIASTLLMYFLGVLISRKYPDDTKGIIKVACSCANNGFLGIPLATAVFGTGSRVLAYVITLNIVMNLFLTTVGEAAVSGEKSKFSLKKFLLSPIIISFVVGLIFNRLSIGVKVKEIKSFVTYLSNLVAPLSMIILGMKLAEVRFVSFFKSKTGYFMSFLRLIISPALTVALALLVNLFYKLDEYLVVALFISTAMPTAALLTTYADKYKKDVDNAVICTMLPTVLSVATIPLLYLLLNLLY